MFWLLALSTVFLGVGVIVFVLTRDSFRASRDSRGTSFAATPATESSDATIINTMMHEKLAGPTPSNPATPDTTPSTETDTPLAEKPWPVFDDLSETDWYYAAVKFVYDLDLMIGVADDRFGPEAALSRAMVVTILHRLSDEAEAEGFENDFTDVAAGAWYSDAINWAVKNNVVLGYGDGRFGPSDPVTYEQLAALLYRTQLEASDNPLPDLVALEAADLSVPELEDIRDYARVPIYTLKVQGFLDGLPEGTFVGKSPATRASIASILHEYLIAMEEIQ